MSFQYAGEIVEELMFIDLPSKCNYIANLRSIEPPADEPTCAICRDEWNYPDLDVVAPSPHCIQHPVHKECLLISFTTEDGEDVSNLCPFCRRELFEKITTFQRQDEDSENEISETIQHYSQLLQQNQVLYSEALSGTSADYVDNDKEDPQLLYPGGPTIEHALQKEDFWSVLPRFLENWYVRKAKPIIVDTFTFQGLGALVNPEAVRLTGEGHAAITALFAHEKTLDGLELSLKAVELLNHQHGEVAMRCIGAAFKYYDDSAFPQHVGVLQRESRWLIAYHVLMDLLTGYNHQPDTYGGQMDLSQWMPLIRFRKMLYEELTHWASNTFFARLLPVRFEFNYCSLLGDIATGNDSYEVKMLTSDADGTTLTAYIKLASGFTNPGAIIFIKDDPDYPVNKHLKHGAIIHFCHSGTLALWELNPGFFHDFAYNIEEGFIELGKEPEFTIRITRRVEEE